MTAHDVDCEDTPCCRQPICPGSFLVAHIFYIVAFLKERPGLAVFTAVPFYSFAVTFVLLLKPGVKDDMLIPVIFYALVSVLQ